MEKINYTLQEVINSLETYREEKEKVVFYKGPRPIFEPSVPKKDYEPILTSDGYIIRSGGYTAGTGMNMEYVFNKQGDYDLLIESELSILGKIPEGATLIHVMSRPYPGNEWVCWAEKEVSQ